MRAKYGSVLHKQRIGQGVRRSRNGSAAVVKMEFGLGGGNKPSVRKLLGGNFKPYNAVVKRYIRKTQES